MKSFVDNKFFLLLISGFLYNGSFTSGYIAAFCAFFWQSILWYVILRFTLSFAEGCIWAATALGIHALFLLPSALVTIQCTALNKLMMLGAAVIYVTLCGGVWFWVTMRIQYVLHVQSPMAQIIMWTTTSVLFWVWILYYSLIFLDVWEGNFFNNPLLAFTAYASILRPIRLCSTVGGILFFLIITVGVVYSIFFRNAVTMIATCLLTGAWIVLSMLCVGRQGVKNIDWINQVVVIQEKFLATPDGYDSICAFQQQCKDQIQYNSHVSYIISPESSVVDRYLNSDGNFRDSLLPGKVFLIGGFRGQGVCMRNSIFAFFSGNSYVFDKRHAMPCAERVPRLGLLLGFDTEEMITPSCNVRPLWSLGSKIRFVPYICSELFFSRVPDDVYVQEMIIALCNDSWASMFTTNLMWLTGRYRAIEWNRDILYISYKCKVFFGSDGQMIYL